MSDQAPSDKLSRRRFLKSAAAVSGAATATALGSQVQTGVEEPVAEQPAPASKKGYRETPHIRQYYEKARF